ncbi:MAG TPA: aspartate/glutamate racemase family protein, partial [Saprospiraceae bacterium]|nr:aspartate/glutamate racemase family protein [Saprospiraceae bacterium]
MKSEAARPIGVFDSGIGGLTVASAIHALLPRESLIYFGDTAHLPYGEKSHDAIRYYSLRICRFLLEKNCKAIVVACNSASTAAYEVLLEFFKDKAVFVNVVDPLVEDCCRHPFEKVGLIATHATVQSGVYDKQFKKRNSRI